MNREGIKKNFIYQLLYQIVILVIPLIISPILTRVLGDTALGIYSYVNSIAYYFVVFANLGIAKHGQRAISSVRNDSYKLRKCFWSLFLLHIISSVISLIFYSAFIILFVHDDINIYWINLLYVSSALFDITWLFYGLENFRSVVIKNFAIRIITMLGILLFVKTPNDLPIYTTIETATLLLGNISLIPSMVKNIKPIKIDWNDCKKHIKPLLILAISVVAISLYTVFDKTLLGLMTNKENVAYYDYSNKIINIPKTFITIIGTVLFPRACFFANNGDFKAQKKIANMSYIAVSFLSFGFSFGLLSISQKFVNIYYGESFSICGNIIKYMVPLIFIIGFGDVLRTIFIIPKKKDVFYIFSVVLNSIVNIIVSVLLIPYLEIYGAIIGTISAEIIGLIIQILYCKKEIDFKFLTKTIAIFLICGLGMYCFLTFIDSLFAENVIFLILEILIGGLLYFIFALICFRLFYKDLFYSFFDTIKSKLNKK